MKAPSDIASTARLPPHGPLCHGSLMGFSSMLRTSMSTMRGLRPQEPQSCLNRRMGRRRGDIELRISKDIDGCSWHETSRHAIHNRNGSKRRCRLTTRTYQDAIVTSTESDYLFRLAALSLSFVGFSAVVVTLRGALGGELSDRHLRLVRLYIEGGLLVTALALVPTLFNLVHVPGAVIWPLSSAAAGSIFTFVLLIQFRRRRTVEGRFPPWVIIIFVVS